MCLKRQRWLVVEGVSWKKDCHIFLLSLLAEEWRDDLFGLTGLMVLSCLGCCLVLL